MKRLKETFSGFWKRIYTPKSPVPSRMANCAICGAEVKTTIMEGEVAHLLCKWKVMEGVCKEETPDERRLIDLVKTALREHEEEAAKQTETGS